MLVSVFPLLFTHHKGAFYAEPFLSVTNHKKSNNNYTICTVNNKNFMVSLK
jgi:hypothetical protein